MFIVELILIFLGIFAFICGVLWTYLKIDGAKCRNLCIDLVDILMSHEETKNSKELDGICELLSNRRCEMMTVYSVGRINRNYIHDSWYEVVKRNVNDFKRGTLGIQQLREMCGDMIVSFEKEEKKEHS